MERFKLYRDADDAGPSQSVLPGMETQLHLREQDTQKDGKKEKQKRQKDPNGHTPIPVVPESLRNKPLRERKDID